MLNKKEILSFLRAHGIHPQKNLGQNFLVDKNLLDFILRSAHLNAEDVILEVGTGLGTLTGLLAQGSQKVISLEIDPQVQNIAKKILAEYSNIIFFLGDVLQTKNKLSSEWLPLLPESPLKMVSNLPYNIASPLLILLLKSNIPITQYTVLVQKEVADKMKAPVGDKNYGRLSVILQALGEIRILNTIPPQVFWPVPKIDSALLEIKPLEKNFPVEVLDQILRAVFTQRRKKTARVLEKAFSFSSDFLSSCFASLAISADSRAEHISVPQYLKLAEKFSPLLSS